jgi:hypothetical protein
MLSLLILPKTAAMSARRGIPCTPTRASTLASSDAAPTMLQPLRSLFHPQPRPRRRRWRGPRRHSAAGYDHFTPSSHTKLDPRPCRRLLIPSMSTAGKLDPIRVDGGRSCPAMGCTQGQAEFDPVRAGNGQSCPGVGCGQANVFGEQETKRKG